MVSEITSLGSIIVWNVCGLGGREKKRCLRNLGRKFNLDILGILETKLENLNDFTITAIWGHHPRVWYVVLSLGLSGGDIMYIPDLFCVSSCSVVMNGRILHVEGIFTQFNLDCLVSFVYALNVGNLKNELWKYLVTFRDSVSKPWCLVGDFNETLFPSDRKGSSQITSSMKRFKNCIDCCDLIELPLNGRKFTWSQGNAASRIDRIFLSGDWLQPFPSSTLFGLSKYSSDHRPLHLLLDSTN